MSLLEVPGARLHYEASGNGPAIVMVPGSSGTGEAFKGLAEQLAPYYTAVVYDRRGFSRSQLEGPQDYDYRLATDAEDLLRLAEHVSGEPAIILGVSSGAIIALEALVLAGDSSAIRTIVPYEPPAVRQLRDGQKWLDFFSELYDVYRRSGIPSAQKMFAERCFAETDRQVLAQLRQRGDNERVVANARYWFEHELRQYPRADLDIDALRARASHIIPMAGRMSHGYPCYQVAAVLSEKLGRDLIEMPGGHLGSVGQPAEFAREFMHALERAQQDA